MKRILTFLLCALMIGTIAVPAAMADDLTEPKTVEVVVTSPNGDPVQGVTIELYEETSDTENPLKLHSEGTSDENGMIVFTGITETSVALTMKSCPAAFSKDTNLYKLELPASTVRTSFTVRYASGELCIHFIDAETGTAQPQGDALLDSISVNVYASETIVSGKDTFVAGDLVGQFAITPENNSISGAPGSYTIKVMASATGYQIPESTYNATITKDSLTEITIGLDVLKQSIEIRKTTSSENASAPEEGAKFEVYPVNHDTGTPVAEVVTDVSGVAVTDPLPYGEYRIEQTAGADGYDLAEPKTVMLKGGAQPLIAEFTNFATEYKVRIFNVEKGSDLRLAGGKFMVQNAAGQFIDNPEYEGEDPEEAKIFMLNDDLEFVVPLMGGVYTLHQVEVPEGYIEADPMSFVVDSSHADDNKYVSVAFENASVMGKIEIHAKVPVWTGVTESDTEYGKLYSLTYEDGNVPGLEVKLYAKEDIVDNAGNVIYTANALIDTIDLDESARSVSLHPGSYTVKSEEVPAGYRYANDATEYSVDVELDENELNDNNVVVVDMAFEAIRTGAKLTKTAEKTEYEYDEEGSVTGTTTVDAPGEGFSFGIYTSAELVLNENTAIPADSLVCHGTTDENGELRFDLLLPYGAAFYVQEIATNAKWGYAFDEAKYEITTAETEDTNDIGDIYNRLYITTVHIPAVNENGEGLAGVRFEVICEGLEEPIYGVTEDDGTAAIVVAYDETYSAKAVEAPSGYALNDTPFVFTVSANDVADTPIEAVAFEKTEYIIQKVNEEGVAVEDCKFTMYKVVTDETTGAISLVEYANAVSDETGRVAFTGFEHGEYSIREVDAPKKYQISGETLKFAVDGTWKNAEDPTEFINLIEVKTGVGTTHWLLIAAVVVLVGGGIGLLLLRKRKNKNE